jgi:peptidoglycan/xylan/chitin deacetylase (PgdA/CDA1 family)
MQPNAIADNPHAGTNRVPVLMYHRIGDAMNDWERKYCASPTLFLKHMKALADKGMQACSIEDFVAWLDGKSLLAEQSFLLTFDDGFYGVYEYAMPVLADLGWPATVFLVSSLIGKKDIWCEKENPLGKCYPLLGQKHINEMCKHGFAFHSHSRTHADLTKISDKELMDEVAGARAELQDLLGSNVPYFAYPYGRYNESVLEMTKQAGYSAAFSVQPGFNRAGVDHYRIRRIDVSGTDTPSQLLRKVSLGSNDGSWLRFMQYYARRASVRFGLSKDSL